MNSPGGINNHPVIIRAQYGSVDAGYISGGLQPNPARTTVLELTWRLLWRALVVLTINIHAAREFPERSAKSGGLCSTWVFSLLCQLREAPGITAPPPFLPLKNRAAMYRNGSQKRDGGPFFFISEMNTHSLLFRILFRRGPAGSCLIGSQIAPFPAIYRPLPNGGSTGGGSLITCLF